MTNTLLHFLIACMVLQVVTSSLREFRNLAPHMEMHMVFIWVRNRVIHNELFCLEPQTDTCGKKNCKLLGKSL